MGRGRRTTSTRHLRRGNAVLDAALVFPVLLSLTFGSVEFGHYFYVKHTLQGAAREGARVAITPSSGNGDVTSAIQAAMTAAGFSPGSYTIKIRNQADTADLNVNTATAGTPILVKVTAGWGTVGIRPLGLIGSGKQVIGQSVMRKEG